MEKLDKQRRKEGLVKLFPKKCFKSLQFCYGSFHKDSHTQAESDLQQLELGQQQELEQNAIMSTERHSKQHQGGLLKLFSKKCSKSLKLCGYKCSHTLTKSKKQETQQQMLRLMYDYENLKEENLVISHELEDKTQLHKLLDLHYKSLSSYATIKEVEVDKLEREVKIWTTRATKAETALEVKDKVTSRALAEAAELRLVNDNLKKDHEETMKQVQTLKEGYEFLVVDLISQVQQGNILKTGLMEELMEVKSHNDKKEMTLKSLSSEVEILKQQNVELRSLVHKGDSEKKKLESEVDQLRTHLVSLTNIAKSSLEHKGALMVELIENLKMTRSMNDERTLALEKLKLEVETLRVQNLDLSKLVYQQELEKKISSNLVLQINSVNSTIQQPPVPVSQPFMINMHPPPGFEAQAEKKPCKEGMIEFRKTSFLISNTLFEVDAKYSPMKLLGSGSYGVVCSFMDKETGEMVAIKKIQDSFFCQVAGLRTLREIRILRHLNHPNVITLKDVMLPVDRSTFKEAYLVYELMDSDLEQVISSPMHLTVDHYRHIMLQILLGLKYLHNGNILHRDLKPANLFIDKNFNIKIGDFGLARTTTYATQGQEIDWHFTDYVVSRWYRAPEILLGCPYGKPADMWSVGCIFAEILARKPFLPGADSQDQLDWILSLVGRHMKDDLKFIHSENCKQYIVDRSCDLGSGVDLFQLFPESERLAIDLLRRFLTFNPAERITIAEALHHPYFCEIYDPMVILPELEPIDVEVKGNVTNVSILRELVWEEMLHFNAAVST